MAVRKVHECRGGKVIVGDDSWVRVENNEGQSCSFWCSLDDLQSLGALFSTFYEFLILPDDK
jgi:hypothetical protein